MTTLSLEINLTESQYAAIQAIARQTGKAQTELIELAVERLIAGFQVKNRRRLLRQGRGLWKDRQDLPDFARLRREWDRT